MSLRKVLFLPGASGNTAFSAPAARLLSHAAERVFAGYPGFGPTPALACVNGLDDLVDWIGRELDRPTAIVAQSVGSVVALLLALRHSEKVTHLVLSVTSGGLDTAALGARDWRPDFLAGQPQVPRWLADTKLDLTRALQAAEIPTQPVCAGWG